MQYVWKNRKVLFPVIKCSFVQWKLQGYIGSIDEFLNSDPQSVSVIISTIY